MGFTVRRLPEEKASFISVILRYYINIKENIFSVF